MLAVRLDSETETRLTYLSRATGRSKSYYVKQTVDTFLEDQDQEDYLLAAAVLERSEPRKSVVNPEKSERFVRVEWLDSVDEKDAFDEVGLFGNQNTVCRPETPKWRHTVERLKERFKKWEGSEIWSTMLSPLCASEMHAAERKSHYKGTR
ncbi:MAG: hypothetical protein A2413_19075 [Treponema sp. RIFOXYC1_FULL_61_9]|nr:MAG: hypothetical protein A2413_19075 [Treponema sp. RIFOXYC1_FULL_61_9]